MVRISRVLLLVVFVTDVRSQFYDFFSAFQPLAHPIPRYQYDITTKRPKTEKVTRTTENPKQPYIEDAHKDIYKERQKLNSHIDNLRITTVKPIRKTTKQSSQNRSQNSREREQNKTPKERTSKPKERTANRRIGNVRTSNDDRIIFDDGRRNTISYETTRRYQDYDSKRYQTEYPFTIRPGVKPAVTHGPPITNKPPQRPSYDARPNQEDTTVSPELIIGPDEDYMSSVEKRRYIELAERMCDEYKSLDNKQVQAIPLLPSPDVVKVNVSTCTPTTNPLVVGGKVVTVDEFPHMALLGWLKIRNGGYSWKCGGSLISNKYVLTAAHCAYQDRDNSVVMGAPRVVHLGSSFMDDRNAILIKVAAVIRHPKYKLPKSYYDLAIVKLATAVTFSNVVKPACLGVPPPPGEPVIVTGWGRTEFGGDQSQELRSVSLPVWNMDECADVLGTSRKIPDGPSSESQICAGEKRGGKDTCQGDSGGPAQIIDGCSWRVVAVTSLGRSCGAPNTPALYAKVQKAFISAVVFGDQINKNKLTTQSNQQSNEWIQPWNNQQTNTERKNQQNGYNTESNNRNQQSNTERKNQQNGYNTESNTRNQQWNVNQQSNTERKNQQNGYNTESNNRNQQPNQQWNVNRQTNSERDSEQQTVYNNKNQHNNQWDDNQQNIYNANVNKQQNDGYNSNGRRYNNDFTTIRPVFNKPQSSYDDNGNIRVSDYESGRNPYYTGRTWWA